jgi:hypothetical protein
VKLQLIEGGRTATDEYASERPDAAAVRAEAARRLRESGSEAARVKELLTARPVPPEIQYLRLQVEYAAAALSTLAVIPADFRDDRYWPSPQAAAVG